MGEKTNLVLVFERTTWEREGVDSAHITTELARVAFGAPPRHWIAVRDLQERNGAWPLSAGEMSRCLREGEVVAAYPRDDGSSVDGAIVWSLGQRLATATIAIPAEQAIRLDRAELAVAVTELVQQFGVALCVVGNELELNDDAELNPSVLGTRPEVELVVFPSDKGLTVFGPGRGK